MATRKRTATTKGASRGRTPSSRPRTENRERDYDRDNDRGRGYDDRNDDRDTRSDDRGSRGRGQERTRLTGLWPSQKNRSMWTGRATGEDLKKILDKLLEAEKTTGIAAFFCFENNRKRGPKDPDFTIYVDVGQEFKGRGGNGGGRGGDRFIDDNRGRGGYRDDRF